MQITNDDLAGFTDEELALLGQMVLREQERRRATQIYIEETLPPADEPGTDTPDVYVGPFVQPTGAHDAFQIGDVVSEDGYVYQSTIPNNMWAPSVYPRGWRKIWADDPAAGKDPEPETPA